MSKDEVIGELELQGVIIREDEGHSLLCEEDGLLFRVVLGSGWEGERWMSNVSHIDSILRMLQLCD